MAAGSDESKTPGRDVRVTVTHVVEFAPATLDAFAEVARIMAEAISNQAVASDSKPPASAPGVTDYSVPVEQVFRALGVVPVRPTPPISPAPAQTPTSPVTTTAAPARPSESIPPVAPGEPAPGAALAATPQSPAPPAAGKLYTPAREAVVRERYPAGMHLSDIRDLLNKLPGRPFQTDVQVHGWATAILKLRRPAAPAASDAADDGPTGVSRSTAKPPPAPPSNTRLTAERIEVLTREFCAGTPINDVDKLLRALPGEPIPIHQIAPCAARLGLARPAKSKFAGEHQEPSPRLAATGVETVDWNTARQWARVNCVTILDGTTKAAARNVINDARARMCLPPWNIIEPRTPFEKLPDPHLGASYAP